MWVSSPSPKAAWIVWNCKITVLITLLSLHCAVPLASNNPNNLTRIMKLQDNNLINLVTYLECWYYEPFRKNEFYSSTNKFEADAVKKPHTPTKTYKNNIPDNPLMLQIHFPRLIGNHYKWMMKSWTSIIWLHIAAGIVVANRSRKSLRRTTSPGMASLRGFLGFAWSNARILEVAT